MSWRWIKAARRQRVGFGSAKAVLICLAHHADDAGYCWPSQQTIAGETELSIDTVQRVLRQYLEPKYVHRIKRKSSDGRRISHGYQLILDHEPDQHKGVASATASCGVVQSGRQAASASLARPQTDTSQDRTARPKVLRTRFENSSGRRLRETLGGIRLEERLGKEVFLTWFKDVEFIEERNQVLILQARSRFVASRVEQQFDSRVLECFRPEFDAAVRVRVIVRQE